MNQDTATAPLFILGAPRSGTTMLAKIVHQWWDHSMGPEGSFIVDCLRKAGSYGDLASDANLARLLRDILRSETLEIPRSVYPPEARYDVTEEHLRRLLTGSSLADVITAVLRAIAECQGKRRLATKYPLFWAHLDRIAECFPASAYLCIVRDGRDVALSTARMAWGENSVYAVAKHWSRSVEAATRFKASHPETRFMLFRYEDLLTRPEAMLEELATFVGLPEAEFRLAEILASFAANPLSRNFGKWHEAMSADDKRIFEAMAGEQLAAMGYERVVDSPSVSSRERLFFEADELLRRVKLTLLPGR